MNLYVHLYGLLARTMSACILNNEKRSHMCYLTVTLLTIYNLQLDTIQSDLFWEEPDCQTDAALLQSPSSCMQSTYNRASLCSSCIVFNVFMFQNSLIATSKQVHTFLAYRPSMKLVHNQGGSVKVTCVRKMADAAALYCVFYLY